MSFEKDPEHNTWKQRLKKRIEHLYNCYNTSIVYNIILFLGLIGLGIVVFQELGYNLKNTVDNHPTLIVLYITAVISFMLMLEQHRVAEAQEKSNIEQRKSNIEQRYNYAITQIESKRQGVVRIGFQNLYELVLEEQSNDKRKYVCKIFCNYLQTESGVQNSNISPATVRFILDLLIEKKNGKEIPFLSKWLDLSNVNFQSADLNNANLEGAQLQGANLWRAQIQGASLSGAQLQGAYLAGAQLQGVDLSGTQLQRAYLGYARPQVNLIIYTQLQGANLQGAQLQGANLWRAQLQGANFKKAQLQGASLIRAQLQGADLKEAEFQGADLKEAEFQGADLEKAQLQGASLIRAQLQGASLIRAQLQGADLKEAQLQGADLEDAKFQGAYLWKAQFQGAKFKDTDFSGTYTDYDNSISGPTDLKRAVARLTARSDQPTVLKNTVFGGGVRKNDLLGFKKKRKVFEKVLTDIKYNINDGLKKKINDDFKEKMDEVENILKQNMGKTENNSIPSGVITGKYPKEEAEVVIKRLNDIADDINALYKQLAGRGLTFDW